MNPHQQNKVDISALSPDEQRLFRLYGKMPTKKDLLQNKLKERKYFDSGDYALSKAGKASDVGVTSIGSRHPLPENIPHLTATSPPQTSTIPSSLSNGQHSTLPHQGISNNGFHLSSLSHSPVKESSFLQRETSFDDEPEHEGKGNGKGATSKSPDAKGSASAKAQGDSVGVSPPQHKEGLPIRR
ncbi:hypothetical protein PABG_06621 [Paracoccidioides brasiliensis Pb03]|uniref:mRNA stability protein n=1 Tax=Paracoccidioides brasiliensis (strain Pb18) TaxID=502780 RepID=C1G2I0_PARBD|nr:uncharacterized protein PADG_02346 [Paracoccidioides brasiliensis Pb18]EEH16534.1 hypothetical protein PABG_06621 [Paracoccidioides brasiliensis Pb03]EEH46196.1 hypothetical protein PADG_02346 [Paracoccidioides brasiliensis Pb18]ODH49683.1 hypothetical protein GX48_04207 [Paracoccidioides brasiliensis]